MLDFNEAAIYDMAKDVMIFPWGTSACAGRQVAIVEYISDKKGPRCSLLAESMKLCIQGFSGMLISKIKRVNLSDECLLFKTGVKVGNSTYSFFFFNAKFHFSTLTLKM